MRLVRRITHSHKWDQMHYTSSYMVPCAAIVAIAIWKNIDFVAWIGLAMFLFFHARFELYQARNHQAFISLFEKIEATATEADT